MIRITVDRNTRDKLGGLSQQLEICDESGRLLGYFRPAGSERQYEQIDPPITEEELRTRESQPGLYTTEQVLRRLEDLDV